MNFFYRVPYTIIRRYTSHLQIKFTLNNVKNTKKVIIREYNSFSRKNYLLNSNTCRSLHGIDSNIDNDIDELENISDLLQYNEILQDQSVRNLLHPNSEDPLIIKLIGCASIQEVLNIIKEYGSKMQHEHVTQAVLVLWDLQKLFYYAHQINKTPDSSKLHSAAVAQNFMSQLTAHPEFHKLLELVRVHHNNMDVEALSCTLLYLNKIGLNLQHDVLQLLITSLRETLKSDISLSALSRFILTVFTEQNVGLYFLLQDTLPIIVDKLDKCETAEDLKLITICLNNFHHIVTYDVLQIYKHKLHELMNRNLLTSKQYRTILKIIMFLNYPRWSDKNMMLISELMLALRDHLHTLNVFDFFIVYEILYKNHEPGELLTEMQRCASRLLLRLEEEYDLSMDIRIKLLSCIISFSSPRHRSNYQKILSKCISEPLTKSSMFDVLRILTFIKPNSKLCDVFWNNALKTIQTPVVSKDSDTILNFSQKYMNYSGDVHYRHMQFETHLLNWLQQELQNGINFMIPSKFALATAFIFAYGKNVDVIHYCVQKISEIWEQFNHADCLYIAKGLRTATEITKNTCITAAHFHSVNKALDKCIDEKLITMGEPRQINFLLKSCIYRRCAKKGIIRKLLLSFNADEQDLSSTAIRNIVYSLQTTNGLLPEMIDKITEYAINYRDNMLGFNMEKVAYLCYYLGYSPKNSDALFQAVTNVIIRDQERITGLSYIQTALSLCFFNKLPDSFIKQIFNVSFLEKLDAELANCYFKDVYPMRVRHNMMQLNRAVCLDYPQSNIPWFHQKYIEQLHNKAKKEQIRETEIVSTIKMYLLKIVDNPDYLIQDACTAYGYHVDFVLNLDRNGQLIKPTENEHGFRIAILLMKPNAYTDINVQLKGQYQLKKRHLEILGYKVLSINLNDWNSLAYGEEKIEYLTKLLWPEKITSRSISAVDR